MRTGGGDDGRRLEERELVSEEGRIWVALSTAAAYVLLPDARDKRLYIAPLVGLSVSVIFHKFTPEL